MIKNNKKLPNPVNYSLWLLNYKPKSIKEMTLALKKRGFDDKTAEETVASLLRWGYLDDEKYKEYVIAKRKHNNPKGRNFVIRELSEAGIECGYEIEDLYTDEEEREIIAKFLRQWCKKGIDFSAQRDRFFRRLYSRGFAVNNISAEMTEIELFLQNDTE